MPDSPIAVIVLAGGEDDRMSSRDCAKVLHGFAGRSLLGHVLAATEPLAAAHTAVVVGHRGEQVIEHLQQIAPYALPVAHEDVSGGAHPLRLALDALPAPAPGVVVVVRGDAPLLTPALLAEIAAARGLSAAAALGPVPGEDIAAAVFDARSLHDVADTAGPSLADLLAGLETAGHRVATVTAAGDTGARVHDRVQLAAAHRAYNARLLERLMLAGVTVVDPTTTWVDAEVTVEPDATLWPAVDLHGATHVGAGASVGPQTSLTDTLVGANARVTRAVAVGARIGADVTIGPFAYLRPGTVLADGVHVGTYVELKKAEVGEGTKIPHLSYVGDATIGEHTNIGAATVFVNYDGVAKHHTVIGSHARTGADNMFVAPVTVGDGAYTAAGSVITQDVPPGAMGVARALQRNVAGWVARKRPGTPAAQAAARALAERDEKDDC